tara:strand:+ start:1021 stop:1350 length:330 start_codon:yes stop_codon:yes gene_type:complete
VEESNIISAGYIDTYAARTLAMEVVIQAVHDYRRLKTYVKKEIKWCGAKTLVSIELARLKYFFCNGGADAYFELCGVNHSGTAIWEKITKQPTGGKWGSGVFTNRTLLG